mgnify:CR=1 FL=1
MIELEVFRIWLYRAGHEIAGWWLLSTLAGLAAWPLAFRLLPRLPDRGYNLSRVVGLLSAGYALWMLGSLGLLRNTTGNAVFAWVIVLVAGAALYVARRGRDTANMGAWLREHWRVIVAGELVFAVLFFGWAVVRAYDPHIAGTEKPMEMAFINALRLGDTFPPHDPWMSGYAISYYYFGYVMIAALANLSGVASGTAFNLSIALFFALAGTAAYSVVFNLVHSRRRIRVGFDRRVLRTSLLIALLGPLFIVLLGNLGGLVQLAWSQQVLPEPFFNWLDIKGYNAGVPDAPVPVDQWNARAGGWWWWYASRVVHDRDLSGESIGLQPIDEFPNFSFLLGDLHPHVLALPFSLLAIALAFNLVRSPTGLDREQIAFYALCLGGLIFLNLLDGPLYMVLIVGAEVLRRLIQAGGRLTWRDWAETALFGAAVGALALLLYLPFFVGFRSQAGGLLPNPIFPTRFRQFFVMFGPFLVIIAGFLAVEWWRGRGLLNWRLALALGVGVLAGLVTAVALLGLVAAIDPAIRTTVNVFIAESGGGFEALRDVLGRRLGADYGVTSVALMAMIVFVIARLFGRPLRAAAWQPLGSPPAGGTGPQPGPPGWTATLRVVPPLLLVGVVAALLLTILLAAQGVSVLALALALMTSLLAGALAYVAVQAVAGALPSRAADTASGEAPSQVARLPNVYTPEAGFVLLLIAAGAVLTLLPEYLYVADNFRARMNTVFKFYYQAWAMWGVACAYAVYSVLGEWAAEARTAPLRFPPGVQLLRWGGRAVTVVVAIFILLAVELAQAMLAVLAVVAAWALLELIAGLVLASSGGAAGPPGEEARPPWRPLAARLALGGVFAFFVAAGLIYPLAGVMSETGRFRPSYNIVGTEAGDAYLISRPDLDGERTMFNLPDDEAAIHCLRERVANDLQSRQAALPVVAEAVGPQYSQYARVATLSGIPTVLGWPGHQGQWRGATYGEIAGSRESDIRTLYDEPFLGSVMPIIERYGIDYIFVGALERRDFNAAGLAKFAGLEVVCENAGAVVYATSRGAATGHGAATYLGSQERLP